MPRRLVVAVVLLVVLALALGLPLAAFAAEDAPPPEALGDAVWRAVWDYIVPASGVGGITIGGFRLLVRLVIREVREEAERHVKVLAATVRAEMHAAVKECPPIRVVVVEPVAEPAGAPVLRMASAPPG
jgi:uncharacterized oligopeptide transporter (OPT) family protein